MSTIGIDIGEVTFYSHTSKQNLKICSTAEIAVQDTASIVERHRLRSLLALPMNDPDRPWVTFDISFDLVLSLITPANAESVLEAKAAIDMLMEAMQQNTVWNNLGVEVLSAARTTTRHELVLVVKLARIRSDRQVNQAPPLRENHHVSPPPYVQTTQVRCFHMSLYLYGEIDSRKHVHGDGSTEKQAPGKNWSNDDLADAVRLLDLGIRHTICALPTRSRKGFQMKAGDKSRSMIDFAPAIWSPTYCSVVAQHQQHLPHLSRALGNVGYRNAHSQELKQTMTTLLQSAASCPQPGSELNRPCLANLVGIQLWRAVIRPQSVKRVNLPSFLNNDRFDLMPCFKDGHDADDGLLAYDEQAGESSEAEFDLLDDKSEEVDASSESFGLVEDSSHSSCGDDDHCFRENSPASFECLI